MIQLLNVSIHSDVLKQPRMKNKDSLIKIVANADFMERFNKVLIGWSLIRTTPVCTTWVEVLIDGIERL